MMRRINLNPTGRDVLKITYPAIESTSRKITLEPMRFLFPFEAKREVEAAERPKGNPGRCWHIYQKAVREGRS